MSRCGMLLAWMSLGFLIGCAKDPQPGPKNVANPAPPAGKQASPEPEKTATQPEKAETTSPDPVPGAGAKTEAAASKTSIGLLLKLNYLTEDIIAAAVIHPKRLLESPLTTGLKAEGALRDQDLDRLVEEFQSNTSLDLREVEELAILVPKSLVQAAVGEFGAAVGENFNQSEQVSKNNLKQIGLAFHNYHDSFQTFPKAGGPAKESDTQKDGLSWRVQLLPYLDQQDLYEQFHLDEPWDSEHNKTLIEKMPAIFQVPGVEEAGKTSIHVFTSAGAPFADNAAPGVRNFTDGTSNTWLAVAAGPDTAEIWTKPGGLEVDEDDPIKCLGELPGKMFLALFADGSVRSLPNDLDPAQVPLLVKSSDGNVISLPDPNTMSNHDERAPSPFLMMQMPHGQMPLVAVQMATEIYRDDLLARVYDATEATTPGGQTYFAADEWAFAFPTDRLVLFGDETLLKELLDKSAAESKGAVAAQLGAADRPFDAAFAVDLSPYAELLQLLAQQSLFAGPIANLRSLTLTGDLSGKPGDPLFSLAGTSSSPETAQTLALILNGLLQSQLQPMLAQLTQGAGANDEARELRKMFQPSLEKLAAKADGTALTVQLLTPEGFERLPKLFAPLLLEQQKAAETIQKRNNIRQLGLAFHNYHDVFNAFPKAGGSGSDNPQLSGALSWRVHLLPFVDAAPLYNQFHMDEPWDSEHNKTLIEKMPDIFKVDGVDEAGKTSIHVFTGPGAPFSDEKAPGIRDITDGTSNTILCVVAGPETAEIWTKPGGLDFDPEDPFKALGTLRETFLILLADGSARNVPKTLEPAMLRNLIQQADGKQVRLP